MLQGVGMQYSNGSNSSHARSHQLQPCACHKGSGHSTLLQQCTTPAVPAALPHTPALCTPLCLPYAPHLLVGECPVLRHGHRVQLGGPVHTIRRALEACRVGRGGAWMQEQAHQLVQDMCVHSRTPDTNNCHAWGSTRARRTLGDHLHCPR